MFSIANATLFAHVLTTEQLPQQFTAWVIEAGVTLVIFQLVVNVVLLVAGAFILSAIILILAPILFPVATRLDIDPVDPGILMVKPGNRPDYPSGRAQAVRHLRRDRHGWGRCPNTVDRNAMGRICGGPPDTVGSCVRRGDPLAQLQWIASCYC